MGIQRDRLKFMVCEASFFIHSIKPT
jgi:hypothetical protein